MYADPILTLLFSYDKALSLSNDRFSLSKPGNLNARARQVNQNKKTLRKSNNRVESQKKRKANSIVLKVKNKRKANSINRKK